MTDAILLTGKRGHGKTLVSIKLIKRYVREGRKVATNLNINIDELVGPLNTVNILRLSDVPTAKELLYMPMGNPNPIDEERNGLLILDEVGSYLNSRNWQGEERQALISWLSQSRKFGWDLLLIAQHKRMVDAQVRDALCDIHGVCKRLDKLAVPFVSTIYKYFTGKRLKLPKFHLATFFYGFEHGAPISWRELFTGSDVWKAYDTTQRISLLGDSAPFSYLSAWQLKGRYMTPIQLFGRIASVSLLSGLLVGGGLGYFIGQSKIEEAQPVKVVQVSKDVFVTGVLNDGGLFTVLLSDGRQEKTSEVKADGSGIRYKVGADWFEVKK